MRDFLTIDENLRTAMRFFGEATGTGEVASLPGMVGIYSGLDYGVFNIAMLDSPVAPHSNDFDTRLREAARYFKDRTGRWSFWLCEDLLEVSDRRRARLTLADCGFRAISHPPGMVANKILPPTRELPTLEVHKVSNKKLQNAFAEITALSFEIPYNIAQTVYAHDRAWRGEYQGYVGFANGRPAAIVAIVVAAEAIGVYSLATDPSHRRRGYAESVMRAAVQDAQERTGIERVVLQSTEVGYPLYRRMGFRDTTRFSVYLTK
jgi:ribosomal protein S18 acetylase RimI-like enzyme